MSVSSATTLISPPAAAPSTTTTTNMQRSNSHHGHTHKARHGHAHHAHHGKRRPSGHSHNTTGHISSGRRGSESDGGRKVAFAALTMAAMDQTAGGAKEKRRKSQEERPSAKVTRSDPQLPRLSRTTSVTSNTSSQHAGGRPRLKEKDSENSVIVVDDEGHEVEEDEDAEDGDWDDEDSSPVRTKDSKDKDPMSAAMRRTMSESVAAGRTQSPEEIGVQPASITSPVSVKKSLVEPHSLMTRKTTGFSGALHPMPEPEPEPVEPAPLKRVQSVKEMAAQAIDSERKMTARKLAMLDHQQYELEQERQQRHRKQSQDEEEADDDRPGAPNRSGSTKGSGLTEDQKNKLETSPSFPFPRVLAPSAAESSAMAQRDASGAGRLYKRSSNTSLRSTTSYRAPPHPLNTQPPIRTAPHSRSGSTAVSPDEFDIRRSMHHPPIAPPVINTESAEGHTWDIPEDREASASAIRQPSSAQAPPISRRDSTTSQRSLRAIFQPTSSRVQASTSASGSGSGSGQAQRDRLHPSSASTDPSRRLTAIEAAAAAAKMHTTTNPALYHQSLGYSPSAAETAHLISRFLPPKRSAKPAWNVTPEMMQDGQPHMGLTEGDYREAHDSLIRQMRDLGNNASSASSRRQDLRRVSKPPLGGLVTPHMARAAEINVGTVKTRNGPLNVSRGGGWRGKTPFELGVERCLAQRPKPTGY